MANSSYNIGEIVILTLQLVNPDYSPITGASPVIEEIVQPDGSNGILTPIPMTEILTSIGTYTAQYLPPTSGNYISLMSVLINGSKMISMDKFIVVNNIQVTAVPKGVSA